MEELLNRIRQFHDQDALRQLYQLYAEKLFAFAFAITRAAEPAEEAVNDVFLQLWKQPQLLPAVRDLPAYLYISTRNAALRKIRQTQSTARLDLDQVETRHLVYTTDPEQVMITRQLQERLQAAILKLPPRCQLIFRLVKEEGLKHREVAAILDISQKTIEAQLTIALKRIAAAAGISTAPEKKKANFEN